MILSVLRVLFGAAFTVVTAMALGTLLLNRLKLALNRVERCLFSFVLGSACLSLLMFAFAALHLVYRGTIVVAALASIGAALYVGLRENPGGLDPPLPRFWGCVFGTGFTIFAILYFFFALAPEHSPDGGTYHLGLVTRIMSTHGFVPIPEDVLKNMPAGAELLFVFAFMFGKHSATALVHYGFLIALPLLMVSFGRRFGLVSVGVTAALLVFAAPVVGMDGTTAYVDVMLTTALFGMFYLLEIWNAERRTATVIAAAILAGFACSIKYTGVVGPLYAAGFVFLSARRSRDSPLRPFLLVASISSVFILPWLIKNWLFYGDPVIPFANGLFPNAFVHPSFMNELAASLRLYGLRGYWQLPWELTMRGGSTVGLIGPAFLLAPLALLACRRSDGRRMLLCTLVFLLPFPSNIGTRFLMPALPTLALAMGIGLASLGEFSRFANGAVALLQVAMCLPWIVPLYSPVNAWRLSNEIPWKPALRIQTEDSWLTQIHPGYAVDRMLESGVPASEPVFSLFGPTEAYTSRHIHVSYLSAQGEVAQDALFTAIEPAFQPSYIEDFHFPSGRFKRLRVVETKNPENAMWSINEFLVFHDGSEIPRNRAWRIRANPNPWDVQLAFDSNLATRWRSWQPARSGMFMEIDMVEATTLDAVRLVCSADQWATSVRLEGMTDSGAWIKLAEQPVLSIRPLGRSLRSDAIAELRRRGYRYLLVNDQNFGADDFRRNRALWGLRMIDARAGARLYGIE